jgi:NOL1/NOP2/sun family putative RNA methylase
MSFFLKRYHELGHDIEPENIKIKPAIRVNTLKIADSRISPVVRFKKLNLSKIPFLDFGYFADADFALSSAPGYLLGEYYIQEAASQLPVQVLDPKPDEIVLDMCAAPGSKTTQIAQYMRNKGQIIALDNSSSRIGALKNNLERCGVSNCVVYHKDAAHAEDLGIMFDKVLLDAPCSGNFATDTSWFSKRSLEGIKSIAKDQRYLLASAINVLKPSGTLVYSTCSLEPEEDEEVIEWALNNHDIKLESTGLDVGEPGLTEKTKLCRRLWPEKTGTQGFFIAKIKKKG